MNSDCVFCNPDQFELLAEDSLSFAIYDSYPVSIGHCLVISKRHVSSWFEATQAEQIAILNMIAKCKSIVSEVYKPDGWNVGINIGSCAGQTVDHLHVHLIPRYENDVADPTGGVRAVIPGKANYLGKDEQAEQRLIVGDGDAFLPHLKRALESSVTLDFASAFIMRSGVELLWEPLIDFISKGGKARILTGDYLNYTDPRALYRLLDLGENLQLRVFETAGQSFHPKAYIFRDEHSKVTGFIGSSNLSGSALTDAVEWNYRVLTDGSLQTEELARSFEELFSHPKTTEVTVDWLRYYQDKRGSIAPPAPVIANFDETYEVPEPHLVQQKALLALERTRKLGNKAGLVVLATGLGKTWLSAFDSNSPDFEKILFVAHREEILKQSVATFRTIRPLANIGMYTGNEKSPEADVLFASIQTLSRSNHLHSFERDSFDYIVVDEFHHAAAKSYRKLIDYFTPKFLLGLTATPERMDGANLLALCEDNIVFENDVVRGIEAGLLCPFKYFGVPDDVDYEAIPWRNKRFDEEKLTEAVATQRRALNALEQFREKGGRRALGFCCSIRHAEFMAEFFSIKGIRAVAVHSGVNSYPRARAIEELANGELDIIFAIDIFNEGLDLPAIDTVLMLRPTQSSTIWLQQFGRGLRKLAGKSHLNVIDYIGNHRSFLVKIRTMLQSYVNGALSDAEIAMALKRLDEGELDLPDGCEITYELEAKDIISGLLRLRDNDDAIISFYHDFQERNGTRPRAGDVYRAGYNPRAMRPSFGSWLGFVRTIDGLSSGEQAAYSEHQEFLDVIEKTQMSKSFKMVLLKAMLNLDALPGRIGIQELVEEYRRIAYRSASLSADVGDALGDAGQLKRSVEKNPIAAWVGGKGTGGNKYFTYENDSFSFVSKLADDIRGDFQTMVREIIDWRLAEYMSRNIPVKDKSFVAKVIHSGGKPIIKLPNRTKNPFLPLGWVSLIAGEKKYYAKFAKEFVNVVRTSPDDGENQLAEILRDWYGEDVGLPGTNFEVRFEVAGDAYHLSPMSRSGAESDIIWRHFMRENIPPLFGEEFNTGSWRQGFVLKNNKIFLLVTLDKSGHDSLHQYNDFFVSPDTFKWQSQNKTAQDSKNGLEILKHQELGIDVHLFIRTQKKLNGKAAPFVYCGEVEFVSWEGERPISVTWKLRHSVPATLYESLGVPLGK